MEDTYGTQTAVFLMANLAMGLTENSPVRKSVPTWDDSVPSSNPKYAASWFMPVNPYQVLNPDNKA